MNPDSNKFEPMSPKLANRFDELFGRADAIVELSRELQQRKPVERPVFQEGELLELRNYIWKVAKCEGSTLTLEGVGLVSGSTPLIDRP